MHDLIRRSELRKRTIDFRESLKKSGKLVLPSGFGAFLDFIAEAPSVDAEEVVRCSKCKYGGIDDPNFPNQYYCHQGHMWNNGEHFCADGKPRMDGE